MGQRFGVIETQGVLGRSQNLSQYLVAERIRPKPAIEDWTLSVP